MKEVIFYFPFKSYSELFTRDSGSSESAPPG